MATAQDTYDRLAAFIKQTAPSADISPGTALSDLLLKLSANLLANEYTVIQQVSAQTGFDTIQANPTATTDTADRLAANFAVSRKEGTNQTGVVKVLVTTQTPGRISQGTQFSTTSTGLLFTQTETVSPGLTNQTGPSWTQLYKQGAQYFFYVPVQAQEAGQAYCLPAGTSLSLVNTTYTGLVSITAFNQFTGGTDAQNDGQLVQQISDNLTVRNFTSPAAIQKLCQINFPFVQQTSAVGVSSPSLQRSRCTPFGFSLPGYADVYLRTSEYTTVLQEEFTGTPTSNPNEYIIELPSSFAPGFSSVYQVQDLSVANQTGTLPFTISYGQSMPEGSVHYINTQADARLSSFQTQTLTVSNVPQTSSGQFSVSVLCQPGIAEVQSFIDSSENRCLTQDLMVKGVRPCAVNVQLTLVRKSPSDTQATLNLSALTEDIASYVNNLPIGQSIDASTIVSLCHKYNISRVELPVKLSGQILGANEEMQTFSSQDKLTIPSLPHLGINADTCQFFLDVFPLNPDSGVGITLI